MTEEQATDKQILFGLSLGLEDVKSMSKKEARLAIDRVLNKDNGEAKPEVEKIGVRDGTLVEAKPKDNGFHLTPEQQEHNLRAVRNWSLASAIQMKLNVDFYRDISTIDLANTFEQYILHGLKASA